jgi:TonB family protein
MRVIARAFAASAVLTLATVGVSQTAQENPGDLNVHRDSAGQIVLEGPAADALTTRRVQYGAIDILSNTQGVDFGPYMRTIMPRVRESWYSLIPASVVDKKGAVAIEFVITKEGNVAGMKLVGSAGDTALDRAAWAGIAASNPFPALPVEFKGKYLMLRFRFLYNPSMADIGPQEATSPRALPNSPDPPPLASTSLTPMNAPGPAHLFMPAILMTLTSESIAPKYPKRARAAKVAGTVLATVMIGANGRVKDVTKVSGDPLLAEASTHAIRKWRFYPAQRDGKPTEDQMHIKVDFRLDDTLVRTQVVPPEPAEAAANHPK